MKLPAFFSRSKDGPAAPSASDLSDRVAVAERAHQLALSRVEGARQALAKDRTEAALEVHRAAVAKAADLATLLGIVRDEHATATTPEALAAREMRLVEVEQEGVELAQPDDDGLALVDAELAAWARVIAARAACVTHHQNREHRIEQYRAACQELGIEPVRNVRGSAPPRATSDDIANLGKRFPSGWLRQFAYNLGQV